MNFDTQLARIEYKLNIIMEALKSSGIMSQELPDLQGIEEDLCPVCNVNNKISIDFDSEQVCLTCGCNLPTTITKGISKLMEAPDASTSKRNVPESGTGEVPPNLSQEGSSDR